MTLTFTTLPLSTNSLYAHVGRRRFMTPKARENKDLIAWEARQQYKGEPLQVPVAVRVRIWWGDRRRHDIDNIKALLDALTGIVWEDDHQIAELTLSKGYSKENPRVEMDVEELSTGV